MEILKLQREKECQFIRSVPPTAILLSLIELNFKRTGMKNNYNVIFLTISLLFCVNKYFFAIFLLLKCGENFSPIRTTEYTINKIKLILLIPKFVIKIIENYLKFQISSTYSMNINIFFLYISNLIILMFFDLNPLLHSLFI